MGLLRNIKKLFSKRQQVGSNQTTLLEEFPLSDTIGETSAVCPSCQNALEKKPSRKKKCPHCNDFMYSRTRPYDGQKILVREDQLEEIEGQWAFISGDYDYFLQEKERKERIRSEMKEIYGKEPSNDDVEWRILNERSLEYPNQGNWGFYRNVRLEMAKHLEKRKNLEEALKMYCEVCYLDSNGPVNTAKSPQSAFSQDHADVAPGLVKSVIKLRDKLDLSEDDLKSIYTDRAAEVRHNLSGVGIPITPTDAFKELQEEIEWHESGR